MKLSSIAIAAALAAVATPVLAHPGHGVHTHTLLAGTWHPLSGLDHITAMVAVGLWAAFLGGRALWLVPVSFVLAMIVGFGFGTNGMVLPAIEPGIAASVIVLGVLIAMVVRVPLLPAMAIVGLFGLFHGQAHGAEMTGTALMFGLGFTISTVALHATGLAIGSALGRQRLLAARLVGAVIAGSGLLILGGVA
jgi:urease accessory protein